MREVSGFISAYGNFFETYEEARFDEANNILTNEMNRSIYIGTYAARDECIEFINSHIESVLEYCLAYKALYSKEEQDILSQMNTPEIIDDGQASCTSPSEEGTDSPTPDRSRSGGNPTDEADGQDDYLQTDS